MGFISFCKKAYINLIMITLIIIVYLLIGIGFFDKALSELPDYLFYKGQFFLFLSSLLFWPRVILLNTRKGKEKR